MWDNASGTIDIVYSELNSLSRFIEGLDQGQNYLFKVLARNVYGYGAPSNVAVIKASDVPDAMQTVSVIQSGTEITILWNEPNSGGDPITEYQLELFIPATQSFVLDTTECDGSNLAVLTTTQKCYRHAYLISQYGFNIGEKVKARARAYNVNGWGTFSQLNTDGASVQSIPQKMNTPIEGSSTTVDQIQLHWSALTTLVETGNTFSITSYNL